ncbi:hypothetical protein BC829DRAFT_384006, partial [Chytridium lagenaria]
MHTPSLPLILSILLLGTTATQALYSKRDAVIEITPANFKKEIVETKHAVIAEFYAPWCGHCKNLAPEYKKAAEKLKGLAKVVAIDCDAHKDLCGKYQIQGFPTLKVFGADKRNPSDYNGPRNAKGIVDAGKSIAFDKFIADALSAEYFKKLTFGEIKASEEDVAKLNVSEFPAVLVFPKGEEKPDVFSGEMKHAKLIEFLGKYSSKTEKESAKEEKTEKKEEPAPAVFDPVIPEIMDQKTLEDLCLNIPGVCILSFHALEPEFPESLSANKAELEVLSTVKKTFFDRKAPFTFTWVNALQRGRNLMQQFDVSEMYPSLVAVNSKKGVYVHYRGAFDVQGVTAFLGDLRTGKTRNVKFSFKPELET